jgi:hypothetical protein
MRYEGAPGRGRGRTVLTAVVVILAVIGLISIFGFVINTVWWFIRMAVVIGLIALVVVIGRAAVGSRR